MSFHYVNVCLKSDYTYNSQVYCGKGKTGNKNIYDATNTVLVLLENLLDKGKTIYKANFYSSIFSTRTEEKENTFN